MSHPESLLLGAVAYDPKVVTIWEGFRGWFDIMGFQLDFVLYSNYERQVQDLLEGRIDVAWNSPLAWVRARRMGQELGRPVEAVAMRDTDMDLSSVVVVRADSPVTSIQDLAGGRVATGAVDSPQATLLPLAHLADSGLVADTDFVLHRFEVGMGLHGDHIGGEREAARALMAGEVDAACMIDSNHLLFSAEGTLTAGATRVIAQTDLYDHCNMTVAAHVEPSVVERFTSLLLAMDYCDSEVRPLLDLEGLKRWRPGRLTGYQALEAAVDRFGFYDHRGEVTAVGYHP